MKKREKFDDKKDPMFVYEVHPGSWKKHEQTEEDVDGFYKFRKVPGCHSFQGLFGIYEKGINGDYNNVVGLPVARLFYEMKKSGINYYKATK